MSVFQWGGQGSIPGRSMWDFSLCIGRFLREHQFSRANQHYVNLGNQPEQLRSQELRLWPDPWLEAD
jgi:hypothetical protein